MTAKYLDPALIDQLVGEAFARKRPLTQEECCDIAAHVAVIADDGPWTDEHVLDVAAATAKGLFGPAFEAADYDQRSTWVDMCERSIRKAIV